MLFSELYSVYYNAVAAILKETLSKDAQGLKISQIAKEHAFGESFLKIEQALKDGSWQLLREDGRAAVQNEPKMPLTVLQKRWLNAIAEDPRMRLFGAELPNFPEVEPLFCPEDICVFDRYGDGDDYASETYVCHFRLILDAVKNRYPLKYNVLNRKGQISYFTAQPEYLEYSEKDDKFRVVNSGCRYGEIINVNKIVSCKPGMIVPSSHPPQKKTANRKVVLEVTDERNALERVLLHFAHFAKEAERLDDKRYRVTVEYDFDDETEIVIRVLSFGPFVRAVAPQTFVNLIKQRLLQQKSCGLF